MPRIAAVATAVPPHEVVQAEARRLTAEHFQAHRRDVDRLLPVFDHAGIETRYLCVPTSWFAKPRSFREKNELYIEWSTRLGAQVTRDCLNQAGLAPEEIDHIIFVSTTGLATPSIDARLINVLGLNAHVRRTPLWGLGCAGGAAGLSHAHRSALAKPHSRVMLVAVELCALTFNFEDYSKANFVASALFADGAAGVLIVGDSAKSGTTDAKGPSVLGTLSTTWPDSLDVMGWNFDSVGMQVVFSRAIPEIVRRKVRDNMNQFLHAYDLEFGQVKHLIAHPGGAKVIDAYEEALSLTPERLVLARAVLRDYGNMSSPSVLFVLDKFLSNGTVRRGDYAVLTALGPGFSAENILLRF